MKKLILAIVLCSVSSIAAAQAGPPQGRGQGKDQRFEQRQENRGQRFEQRQGQRQERFDQRQEARGDRHERQQECIQKWRERRQQQGTVQGDTRPPAFCFGPPPGQGRRPGGPNQQGQGRQARSGGGQ